jgi:hypothetical protein
MEQVAGIWQRVEAVGPYFVAVYACPTGDLGAEYLGYFRIFSIKPGSYFDAGSIRDGMAADRHGSPEQALMLALRAAQASLHGGG